MAITLRSGYEDLLSEYSLISRASAIHVWVKYPNGRIVRYGIVGQGSPAKGRNYLFFLSRAEQGNYNILTAYELQGNKVQALDGARVNLGLGKWVFDKHNNEDYQAFRKATEQAIQNNPDGIQKRRFNP